MWRVGRARAARRLADRVDSEEQKARDSFVPTATTGPDGYQLTTRRSRVESPKRKSVLH